MFARPRRFARQAGFTYLAVLVALAMLALASNAVMTYVSQQAQREREDALLNTGQAIVQAIADYYAASPGSIKKLPQQLSDLLDDKRQVVIRRYLREIYPDPTTGRPDWDFIRDSEGGIRGLRSRNTQEPVRQGAVTLPIVTLVPGPASTLQTVASTIELRPAKRYTDWRFEFNPVPAAPGLRTGQGAFP